MTSLAVTLKRLARGADEIAQHGDIGAVGTEAARVHGEAETFREFEIDIGVVQLREAETSGGENTVQAARINGAWRTVTLPGAARQLVELLPIAFVPSRHANFKYVRCKALDAAPR